MSIASYDLIVIGAGPAGLTAATEAARAGLKVVCLDKLGPGGALINLGALHEFEETIDGPGLCVRLADQAMEAGVEIDFGEVTAISANGSWKVETAEGSAHAARALVIASGLNKGKLGVPNESAYEGRGLSHCAVCDGPLYAGQPVVVAGYGGWADVEARELQAMVGLVTVVNPERERIVALEGKDGLEAVVVESAGGRKSIPARAVFVYHNETPAAEFLPDSLARDASGHIVVDAEGRTSVPLVFAVGDVRSAGRRRLTDAIADGQRAGKALASALKKKVN
jgi:thioredoxin reductase (NADPH)